MAETQGTSSPEDLARHLKETIAKYYGWFIALGFALIVLGGAAIIFPFLFGLAAEQLLGWLLLFGGLIQCVHSYRTKTWSGFLLELVIGLLYLAAGFILITNPIPGIITLTLLLIVLFVADGILECIMAFRIRPAPGWGWVLVSGLVSLLIGGLIWAQFPSSSIWAIGLLVGINLIFSGVSFVSIALGAKDAETEA